MKKAIFIISTFMVCFLQMMGQQQPMVMIIPDDNWCVRNGYVLDSTSIPDYNKALGDENMSMMITAMGGIMADRGYNLTDLAAVLEDLKNEKALDETHLSKGDGQVAESELDQVLRKSQADIIVKLGCQEERMGPRAYLKFEVKSVDAASLKQIGGEVGNSAASGVPIPTLLKECANGFMDHFCANISRNLDDIEAHGREGSATFVIADDCPIRSFESEVEFQGEHGEFAELIDYWLNENTVNGQFTQTIKTRNKLSYKQVRFPHYGKAKSGFGKLGKPRALTMQDFIKAISDVLPAGVSMSTTPIGQGKVHVVFGGQSNL